ADRSRDGRDALAGPPSHRGDGGGRAARRCDAMTARELLRAMARELPGQPPVIPADAALDVPCTGVAYDSRKVTHGSVFVALPGQKADGAQLDRKSTRLNSSHQIISYAVFCLKKK